MLAHAIDNAARTATSKGAHSALRHPDSLSTYGVIEDSLWVQKDNFSAETF